MADVPVATRRLVLIGLAVGCLTLGIGYLARAVFGIPLLPEEAGGLVVKVLPLPVFEAVIRTLGVLARPLLLVGSTVGLIVLFGAATVIIDRRLRVSRGPAIAGVIGLVTLAVGLVAGDGIPALIEATVLAVAGTIAYSWSTALLQPGSTSDDRRVLLRNLLVGSVGLAVLGIAYVDVRRFVTALATREGTRSMTEITPVADFYVVSKNIAGDPVVDANGWHLVLPDGASLTYAELLALPAAEVELTLSCISNEIGGTLISNGRWRGPRVTDLLAAHGGDHPEARWLLMEAADGYTESLPLDELTPDHLLATHLDGEGLPWAHGFPARFIFPGHYGMKQPKWVTRLQLSATDQRGYWEQNGWNERAVVKTMSRIDTPLDGLVIPAGSITIRGIAFAGNRRISAVEIRFNNGAWQAADLDPEFSPYAWRFWGLTVSVVAGHYDIEARARDGTGAWQTPQRVPTLPDGASGYHRIALDVQ
ncbi:MAG TPA: molybdopterin-dependent oxidoreductase [Candidatus Dormibacteraeota bacterium]|nr:molybdopterin-dependent oxidoreductase [Candidatus Dormibacteraeota bacterium]